MLKSKHLIITCLLCDLPPRVKLKLQIKKLFFMKQNLTLLPFYLKNQKKNTNLELNNLDLIFYNEDYKCIVHIVSVNIF